MLIGISGKKGSGKSSLARFLKAKLVSAAMCSFATGIKSICTGYCDASTRAIYGTDEDKETEWRNGITHRQLMQRVGTFFRELDPDFWVKLALDTGCLDFDRHQIFDDVRFPNEVEGIRSRGGKVIRLLRAPFADDHPSETALDNYPNFDLVIPCSYAPTVVQDFAWNFVAGCVNP